MSARPSAELGICQWFHYHDYHSVELTVSLLRELGAHYLRTGISWADFHRPDGANWYRWQMEQLAEFEVLLSVWHTPPSISEGGCCSSPPRDLGDYRDFLLQVIDEYGAYFQQLELWNEPNNRYKWNFAEFDPQWRKFGQMIRQAAKAVKRQGIPTVLGGMIPVDHHWLKLMEDYGALEAIDIVAIHGFPEMWWPDHPNWEMYQRWHGWSDKVRYITRHGKRPVWITETGLATWDLYDACEARFSLQTQMLLSAASAPAERVYWYSLIDLSPSREAIEGFHVDENEYHLGLVTYDGARKPAFFEFQRLCQQNERLAADRPIASKYE
jgi:CDP-paratose 2-epimerase